MRGSKTHKDQRKHRKRVGRTPAGMVEHQKRVERRGGPGERNDDRVSGGRSRRAQRRR